LVLLINASNLHNGGGLAVASSVVDELSRQPHLSEDVYALVSSEVHGNLVAIGTDIAAFHSYRVFDLYKYKALWARVPVEWSEISHILNVFGPIYTPRLAWRSTSGFAQPNIAFPGNLHQQQLPPRERLKSRLKHGIQSLFFLLPTQLIVEQVAVADGLRSRMMFRSKVIRVVPNTVAKVHWDRREWAPVELPTGTGKIKLGLVARNNPHKNIKVLAQVKEILEIEHDLPADFYVTLSEEHWLKLDESTRGALINVGELEVNQSPYFNAQLDGVVFPSLLECFSATPIEARAVGTPLFASDIPTVRETVGDYAQYFNPLDAADIARVIAAYFNHGGATDPAIAESPESEWTAIDRAIAMVAWARSIPGRRRSKSQPRPDRAVES
jgi:glycosyltransferase involved in cell wall biosynthesis